MFTLDVSAYALKGLKIYITPTDLYQVECKYEDKMKRKRKSDILSKCRGYVTRKVKNETQVKV